MRSIRPPKIFGTARGLSVSSRPIEEPVESFSTRDNAEPMEILRAEYNLIQWYRQHGQLIQALSLAREWLIDAVTVRLEQPLNYHRTPRGTMERAVSGLALVGRKGYYDGSPEKREFTPADLNEYGRTIYDQWPEQEIIGRTWNLLAVRNQLDHAEHQHESNRMKFSKIRSRSNEVLELIADLAKLWGIMETPSDEESGEMTP
jgi:hypothetical protein